MEPDPIYNNPKIIKLRRLMKLNTAKAKSPMELPYMIRLSNALMLLGAWPYKIMGHKRGKLVAINNKFLFIVWTYTLIFAVTYIKRYQKSKGFLVIGHTYISSLLNFVTWHRLIIAYNQAYKEAVGDFVKKIHLFHFKDSSEYAKKVFVQIDTIVEFFVKNIFLQAHFSVVTFLFIPFYFNYTGGMYNKIKPANMTFDHGFYYEVPFNYETDLKNHLFLYALNTYLTHNCAFGFCSFDTLLIIIVFHLWGHIKILKYKLQTFPRPASKSLSPLNLDMYDEEECKNVSRLLLEIIDYHKLIKDYMNQASNAFGSMMCVYSLFHQVTLCILLLESTGHDFAQTVRFGIITIYVIEQLCQLSIIFELLDTESSTIKDYIYNMPWECMNTSDRKTVFLFLMANKEPLSFKALGVLPIGVNTMYSILKTTLSYYMLLRTTTS